MAPGPRRFCPDVRCCCVVGAVGALATASIGRSSTIQLSLGCTSVRQRGSVGTTRSSRGGPRTEEALACSVRPRSPAPLKLADSAGPAQPHLAWHLPLLPTPSSPQPSLLLPLSKPSSLPPPLIAPSADQHVWSGRRDGCQPAAGPVVCSMASGAGLRRGAARAAEEEVRGRGAKAACSCWRLALAAGAAAGATPKCCGGTNGAQVSLSDRVSVLAVGLAACAQINTDKCMIIGKLGSCADGTYIVDDKARLTSPAAALDPSPHAPRGPPACRLCRPGSPAVSTSCGGVMGLCRGLCGTMSSPVQHVHDAQMSATLARKRSREQREKAGNAATKSS